MSPRAPRSPSRRAALAVCLLGLCLCAGSLAPRSARAQTDPPPPPATDVPPPPATDVPPPVPPTAPPPTARPPEDRDDDDDEPDQPAPSPLPADPGAGTVALPARTPRPTRTPRTTVTPTPTPFVAGALRLTLAAEAGAESAVTFRVGLINQGESPATDLTIDITLPPGLILDPIAGDPGQTARAGDLVRWYLPRLEPGAEAALRLSGLMALAGAGQVELCATLISAGSPLEHCARFDLAAAEADGGSGQTAPAAPESALPTAEPAGTVLSELPSAIASGWTLILLGVAALGVWLGLQRRGGRPGGGDGVEDQSAQR